MAKSNRALSFLPIPKIVEPAQGTFALAGERFIALTGAPASELMFAAHRLQAALAAHAGVTWALTASGVAEEIGIAYTVDPRCGSDLPATRAPDEAYELLITPSGVIIRAPSPRGAWNATLTLIQIVEQSGPSLPCLRIADAPDFPNRGVLLDVTRDKVPTLDTLFELVDLLASWKINEIQLYTEHTFAYRRHRQVWDYASPMTEQDILELDAYCRARFIDLVPNQNSLGHMERWLRHPAYQDLAETHAEFKTPWGSMRGPFSLNPTDPRALALMRELYDELLPNFSSKRFNVNLDESLDVGQGQSKAAVEAQGEGRVYLDYLKKIHAEVSARGRVMQYWGDIIIRHPDLVAELPRDAIALEWGYEADHDFADHCQQFAANRVPFYVCPGTSSWLTLVGKVDNARANILNAAENGLRHGAIGLLNTDWGDFGHYQYLPVSYPGFAYGAALSWAVEANRDLDLPRALDQFVFHDAAGVMGKAVCEAGNAWKRIRAPKQFNCTLYGRAMIASMERIKSWVGPKPAELRAALKVIDTAVARMQKARMTRLDADLILREFANAARMAQHGAGRILLAQEKDPAKARARKRELRASLAVLAREHDRLWHARNRPGGYADSAKRLANLSNDYK